MATNADEVEAPEAQVEDVNTTDLEAELREAKAEADKQPAVEAESPATEATDEAQAEPEATLTTEAPTQPEKDLDWYKKAYEESTKEALRLKGELDKQIPPPPVETDSTVQLTPEQLYIKQKQDEEIAAAFADIKEQYPQVTEPDNYKQFTQMANTFGKTILDAQGRLATPKELYAKTAIALGWAAENQNENLGAALKDSAASSRTGSSITTAPKSKVTEEMIALNQKMFPNKSRQEIIEELEPHIN